MDTRICDFNDNIILSNEKIEQLNLINNKRRRYYIYEIVCDITNHRYIGQRSNCYTDPYRDKYMGSGKVLNYEIKKYGIEHFKKNILYEVLNQNELDIAEKYEIKKCRDIYGDYYKDKKNGLCINLVDGGLVGCGFSHINNNKELRKKAMDAAKDARAKKHNGDCMGACHTFEACMKNLQNKKERGTYHISIDAMHSKEAREKAKLTAHKAYLFMDEDGNYHKMARNTAKQHHKTWEQICLFDDATPEQKMMAKDHHKK